MNVRMYSHAASLSGAALLTVLGLATPAVEAQSCIDFETVPPGGTPAEGLEITDQYNIPPFNVIFSSLVNGKPGPPPKIVEVGPPLAGFTGPFTTREECNVKKPTIADMPAKDQPGDCFFLATTNLGETPGDLLVTYTEPVTRVSGILFDIDFDEQWTITARDAFNVTIATLVLTADPNDPSTGNGIATPWEFDVGSAEIHSLLFEYTGDPNAAVGLGFDNFCPSSVGITVGLDIKPGSCPNSFNRNSNGVLPVALVGTDDFDVAEVDLGSILLMRTDGVGGSIAPHEGPPGPHSEFEDVATPFEGELCDCHDLEGDGITDLSMKFKTDDVVAALELNDLPAGDLVELILSGNLLDGTPFEADDCIRLVPPGAMPGLLAMGSNAPGVFIEVTALDETLDGGGFVDFKRTYSLGTTVTLTAPQTHLGWVFVGWDYGSGISGLTVTHQGGLGDRTIQIIVLDAEFSLKAIYRPGGNLP